jgi:nucleotide-binding universal stress UspA family protein
MYSKFLIPHDGSEFSMTAAKAGISLAQQLNAEVVGIVVVPAFQYPFALDMDAPNYPYLDQQSAAMKAAADNYLKQMETFAAAAGVKFSGITASSDAIAQQIVAAANEQRCDLIFMGSHGHGAWDRLLLGSVTAKVLALCHIPVLVYRSKQDTVAA